MDNCVELPIGGISDRTFECGGSGLEFLVVGQATNFEGAEGLCLSKNTVPATYDNPEVWEYVAEIASE